MWRSGLVRRRRHLAMAEVVAAADRSGDYQQPWRGTPQVWHLFSDESDLLRELQRDWRTALAGAIYVAIEAGDGDLRHDVTSAFSQVRRRHLGARRILEANAEHPAIAAAMRKERALLSSLHVLVDELLPADSDATVQAA